MRRTLAALFALATGGFVLAPATAWPSCQSASELPSSEDVARSVGFVAAIDGDTEQIEVPRHGTAVPCLIVGMLLLPGDEVIVKGDSGSIVLQNAVPGPADQPSGGRPQLLGRRVYAELDGRCAHPAYPRFRPKLFCA